MKRKVFITGGSGFIGTNLVAELLERGFDVQNFDLRGPMLDAHQSAWRKGDLMDAAGLAAAVSDWEPDWVIHLAARTECDENTTVEAGYAMNTVGTAHLLEAVKRCPPVKRLLVTSSQFVCGPGRLPESDDDYFPVTVYGQSKVETEKLTRAADPACTWFFTRPVNIWGPYHERYSREFWRIASMGLYVHPDVPAPVRTYGYVGNIIWQMLGLMEAPDEAVHRKVFYIGDRPIRIDEWSLGFQRAMAGREAPRLPMPLLEGMAWVGDGISKIRGKPFILNSSRLRSMTTDYLAPVEPTFELLGEPPWTLEDGILRTAEWYRQSHKRNGR